MKIASAIVNLVGTENTTRHLVQQIRQELGEGPIDLCLLFASAHFEGDLEKNAPELQEALAPRTFIGCTAEAVIRDDQEYEHQPGLVLWAARMPGARCISFHLSQEDLGRLETAEALREHLNVPADENPYFILLGDAFSVNPIQLLERFNAAYPGRPAIGGLASAAEQPEQNVLVFEGQTLRHGMVGVALWGNIQIDTIVSQGCRPIGRHMVVTKAEGNVIHQLGGKPTLAAVDEILHECSADDINLAKKRGLLIGCVINEYKKTFGSGDFLIRNPISIDQKSGAMAVNDYMRTGQTIQFHVRDNKSAADDLDALLAAHAASRPAGALLFSCNGRGSRFFSDRHHDARAVTSAHEKTPLAGFFCAGEIGPIGNRNFLHGFTASIGLFRPAADDEGE